MRANERCRPMGTGLRAWILVGHVPPHPTVGIALKPRMHGLAYHPIARATLVTLSP
jgi:hypothetical protein